MFCTFSLPHVLRASSRHNGVPFFHISTSKSAPRMVCFATFYLKMCFAPQRRALCPQPQCCTGDLRVLQCSTSHVTSCRCTAAGANKHWTDNIESHMNCMSHSGGNHNGVKNNLQHDRDGVKPLIFLDNLLSNC